jgi:hypothetical protein
MTQDYIFKFDIPMDNVSVVHIINPRHYFPHNDGGGLFRKMVSPFQAIIEVAIACELK